MRHQFLKRQRREQAPNDPCNARFDAAHFTEQVVAVNGENHERFADAFAKGSRMVAQLPVDSGSPSLFLRQVERRILLGQHVSGNGEEIREIPLRYPSADGEQCVDLRSNSSVQALRPDRRVVELTKPGHVFFDLLVFPPRHRGQNLAIGAVGLAFHAPISAIGIMLLAASESRAHTGVLIASTSERRGRRTRRRLPGLPRQLFDSVSGDTHRGERLLEGFVPEKIERDVGLRIYGIARPYRRCCGIGDRCRRAPAQHRPWSRSG